MRRFKKKNLLFLFFGVLIFIGVVYAACNSVLLLNTTGKINGNFDVKILSITPNDINGNALSRDIVINEDGLSATFTTDLFSSGDFIEYDVVVKNNGNINAVLDNFNYTINNSSDYISFEYIGLQKNTTLLSNETLSFKIKISVVGSSDEIEDSIGTIYTMNLNFVQQN